MKKLFVVLLFLTSLACRAEVLQYDFVTSISLIGDGISGKGTVRGLFLYDTAVTNFTIIACATNKTYGVDSSTNYPGGYPLYVIKARGSSTYSVLANATTFTNSSGKFMLNADCLMGLNKNLKISTNKAFMFPAVISSPRSKGLTPGPKGGMVYADDSTTLTYNSKRTIPDNDAHKTMAEIADAYMQSLNTRGFRKVE